MRLGDSISERKTYLFDLPKQKGIHRDDGCLFRFEVNPILFIVTNDFVVMEMSDCACGSFDRLTFSFLIFANTKTQALSYLWSKVGKIY